MFITEEIDLSRQLHQHDVHLSLLAEPLGQPGARLQLRLPHACHVSPASDNPGVVAAWHHVVSLMHPDAPTDLEAIAAGDGLWLACEEALYRDLADSGLGRIPRVVDALDPQDSHLPELRELFDAAMEVLADLLERDHDAMPRLC